MPESMAAPGSIAGSGLLGWAPTPEAQEQQLTVYDIDLSAEGALDWTGRSSVELGGVTWTLENAGACSTLGTDGSTGLEVVLPAGNTTTAVAVGQVELRAQVSGLLAVADALPRFLLLLRGTSTTANGYAAVQVRDEGLTESPGPELARIQMGDIGASDHRAQSLSGGAAGDTEEGSASPLQVALAYVGGQLVAYRNGGSTLPTEAQMLTMMQGRAPSGWTVVQRWAAPEDVATDDLWLGFAWGMNTGSDLDEVYDRAVVAVYG